MTPADIAALRGLCERATPGPWKLERDGEGTDSPSWSWVSGPLDEMLGMECTIVEFQNYGEQAYADAAFVAAARTALPALLDECEALRRDIEWMRKSRDDWQATAARTATERRSEEMTAIHAARAAETERDRLRSLLREAVEIGMAWAGRLRDEHDDPQDRTRLAALASEGGVA